jgi:hypothetical protein
MYYGPDTWYGQDVSVLEMDGQFDKLEELIYVESHLSNTSAKFYGEITQQMLKNSGFPGSNNGTGLFQTIVGLKVGPAASPATSRKGRTPCSAVIVAVLGALTRAAMWPTRCAGARGVRAHPQEGDRDCVSGAATRVGAGARARRRRRLARAACDESRWNFSRVAAGREAGRHGCTRPLP